MLYSCESSGQISHRNSTSSLFSLTRLIRTNRSCHLKSIIYIKSIIFTNSWFKSIISTTKDSPSGCSNLFGHIAVWRLEHQFHLTQEEKIASQSETRLRICESSRLVNSLAPSMIWCNRWWRKGKYMNKMLINTTRMRTWWILPFPAASGQLLPSYEWQWRHPTAYQCCFTLLLKSSAPENAPRRWPKTPQSCLSSIEALCARLLQLLTPLCQTPL